MADHTRAHERLVERPVAGSTVTITGPADREVALHIAPAVRDACELVVHFHGAPWLVHQAGASLERPTVAAVVQLGAGSGVYTRGLGEPGAFDSLLARTHREVERVHGASLVRRRVVLTAFSAGHGAVRTILRDPVQQGRVDAVLLLDGLHASYVPEGRLLADGGTLDPEHLAPFVAWGPRGMQQLSEVRAGRFELLGFAGNSAPDHVDHLHGLPEFLARLLMS